ncbi:MAG: hypothetical protein AVDCRST_MAG88-3418 [uncultured Thermomicrobiales bacterium]|uniref:Uncharacterized protein n=1 Tax=uncultured Thermomicrobiales bacterium TaxID=1645740 RepID=A0A6J4VS68_9BACT|nr:MAG: hypothetical protein AVDCRST_MAG88-3418 [uncultured Thermomicrobiales bacterium]
MQEPARQQAIILLTLLTTVAITSALAFKAAAPYLYVFAGGATVGAFALAMQRQPRPHRTPVFWLGVAVFVISALVLYLVPGLARR